MHIAIITGGNSKERDISIASSKYFENILKNSPHTYFTYLFPEQKDIFIKQAWTIDLVIPIVHGKWGEDWVITKLSNDLWLPTLFTSSELHSLCLDKYKCNTTVEQGGFMVPKSIKISHLEQLTDIDMDFPIFVKPLSWWSSFDMAICRELTDLGAAVSKIIAYDDVLLQEYIPKLWSREFTVSILWNYDQNPQVLAISEIITWREFFDFNAKYELQDTKEVTPATIDTELSNHINETALEIYKHLKVTALSRIDFIYQSWKLHFLEVNTIPGFTPTSFFPQALNHASISPEAFLGSQILLAIQKSNMNRLV